MNKKEAKDKLLDILMRRYWDELNIHISQYTNNYTIGEIYKSKLNEIMELDKIINGEQ